MLPASHIQLPLPADAAPAVEIVGVLRAAGHQALLAGGCVRDLLRGMPPHDYDVATDALPARVVELFRATREVGASFGVVLVRRRDRWIEVATFRADGVYVDGRRPERVTFSDALHDAQRRDFTVNGMFLDPASGEIIDYVGGRADIRDGLIRAIGDPAARFAEDHLRLLRGVRFAARLGYRIEPGTAEAIRREAGSLSRVAAERIRDELERMFADHTRGRALFLLHELNLLARLWPGAAEVARHADPMIPLIARIEDDVSAGFELTMAILLSECAVGAQEAAAKGLALSNRQAGAVAWLLQMRAALDDPAALSLAQLKRLVASEWFDALSAWSRQRRAALPDAAARAKVLESRIAGLHPDRIAPPPFVSGDDLLARGVVPGPLYKRVLSDLYERQLNETLRDRASALAAMDDILRGAQHP
ncbi:MAG: CCA tRNA nucleotidyltransferase [Phycisphaerales bacterium]|nr:CCA tRNA nucleotidyltransferase [Phycisphaerales bacterium]